MSAVVSRFHSLDRVVSKAMRLSDGLIMCKLELRCRVAALCTFYKTRFTMEAVLPRVWVPAMVTRLADSSPYQI